MASRIFWQPSCSNKESDMAGPTPAPFRKAFACAGVAFVLVVGTVLLWLGPPGNSGTGANLLGQLCAWVGIAAVITGFLARRSQRVWSMGKIVGIYVLILLIEAVILFSQYASKLPH
jgi:hypothetical protein